ncbi:K02A2.6-like [Cordylochernes scorpioides]|uniref:K02A2.6-like n=1 Tax=Cordylochernes scorpioides TaxID=51811 RepID=A0ABY6L5D3_9ARAC|nr:K02A2.6-like [Cordylochernes scorpioides]
MHCKSIFAHHGILEEVRSDNGPQFGLEFKKFAKEYGFHHLTSSPRFPQSNGFIESMVKNIKNQLKKGRDPYLSLLGYRTAPLENGYSPAELCMNRKLRTTVQISPVQLQSRIPDLENLEMREKNQRHKKKTHFDIHHRARELPHLDEGTRVWVKDLRVPGVVLEDAESPRSYIVNSPKGILRRNRFHLLPNPQGEKIDMEDEEMESPEMSQCFTSTGDNTTCDSEPRTFQRPPETVKTRSGRTETTPSRITGQSLPTCYSYRTSRLKHPRSSHAKSVETTVSDRLPKVAPLYPRLYGMAKTNPPSCIKFNLYLFASSCEEEMTSELKSKKEEEQVNALIYILGEKAEDALISFNLTEIEINNYETVVKKFEEHFIGKQNVIFERAQFNRRYQQDGEAVKEYIRVLHKMAENCNCGSQKEEMIRDRIVVGVKNLQLSEKLQLEPNLTLERAIQAACQTECVKQQQTILRSTTTQAANVDQVYEKKLPPRRFNSTNGKRDASKKSKFQKWSKPEKSGCIRCGASKFHPYKDCPAKEVKCHKCKKVGHFAKVCYNKTVGQVTQGDDYHFVGADVNIIPQEIYFKNFAHKKLCKPDIQLLGPRQFKLHVIGKFTALIEKDGSSIPGEIFVVPQLMQPLLSGKASESLNLIKRLQSIEKRNSLNHFEEYPKLFTGLGALQGSYTIKLKDESQPHAIYTPRRIPIPLLNKTKEQLDQMVEKGVIGKVEQPTDWCAPMVIVPKPSSNDLRICVDLTALNKFVKREQYPIPSVEYTLAQMGGAKLFSKLDANSGFWQIPLSKYSSSLTTFLTPFGRYRFKRLPFGNSSAPEVFQRKMSNLLESQSGVNCHMDDIVIWGATQEEHDERLRCVLRKLQDSGLTLNKEKCIFSVKEINFLGHLITERGVFLGMVNFTGKFILDLSTILYPLNQLLVKRNDWRWDSAQEEAFEKVKKLLSTSPALTLFDPNLPTTVSADASSYGLGAVLLQKSEDGYQKAVAYASRTMPETEKRWPQIEKESLAIVWACERFQDYLMGKTFSIESDHKPLIPIFSTKNLDEMTPRIQRLRLRMMRYSYSIHHTPGKDIVVADALSRSPIKISHEKDLENEICSFVQQITSCSPFKDENMKEIW